MTIERDVVADLEPQAGELVQFLFNAAATGALLQRARALLDSAPQELCDSFEQAMRRSGLACRSVRDPS